MGILPVADHPGATRCKHVGQVSSGSLTSSKIALED